MKQVEELKKAEELGKLAAHVSPDKEPLFRESIIRGVEEDVREKKTNQEMEFKILAEKERQRSEEISNTGNLTEAMVRDNLLRGFFMGAFLFCSFGGEYIFMRWMVAPFGLGDIETALVALTIILINMEGINLYLTSLRKQYPSFENHLFLIFGCVGFVLIILMILFGADIRQNLFQTTSSIGSSSLGETVERAQRFYVDTSKNFICLMVSLTSAITIIAGVSYHDIKNRIFTSLRLRHLHKDLNGIQKRMQECGEEMVYQGTRLSRFMSEFDTATIREKVRLSEEERRERDIPAQYQTVKGSDRSFWRIVVFPIL